MHRRTKRPDLIDAAFETLLQDSQSEYIESQKLFADIIAPFETWTIDEEFETLRLAGQAEQTVQFRLVPIGTSLPVAEGFAWTWAN